MVDRNPVEIARNVLVNVIYDILKSAGVTEGLSLKCAEATANMILVKFITLGLDIVDRNKETEDVDTTTETA